MEKCVILVAEDDADDRFLLQTAFEEIGGDEQLTFTENGVELIDYLDGLGEKPFYGFILLDLNMTKVRIGVDIWNQTSSKEVNCSSFNIEI